MMMDIISNDKYTHNYPMVHLFFGIISKITNIFRIFMTASRSAPRSKILKYIWYFAHLFVPLMRYKQRIRV
jgi:hypothetical protein